MFFSWWYYGTRLYFKSCLNYSKIQKALPPNIRTDAFDGCRLNWTALPALYGPFLQLNISCDESWNQNVSSFKQKQMKLKELCQRGLRNFKNENSGTSTTQLRNHTFSNTVVVRHSDRSVKWKITSIRAEF